MVVVSVVPFTVTLLVTGISAASVVETDVLDAVVVVPEALFPDTGLLLVLLALLVALVVSFLMTPIVKTFAYKVGAIDVPKDARRMHKVPIPRLGGLAIFIGFMVSILLFVEITAEMRSILLGAVIIVVLGVVDDIMALPALLKFVVQIIAALIPALG